MMQQLVNALTTGAVYALVTVGYAMVFSVLNMVNLAHTDVMMLGGYVGWLVARAGGGLVAQLVAAAAVGAAANLFIERAVYRPLYEGPRMRLMTSAIAVSILLEYLVMLVFSAAPRPIKTDGALATVELFGATVSVVRLIAPMLAAAVFVVLALVVTRTKTGLLMRAAAQDPVGALAVGINRNRVIATTFAIGGAAAAIAGVVYGNLYLVTPLMGSAIGIKAFVCTVAGGKGSLWGAVLGAFLLSFSETAVCILLGSGLKDAVSLVLLVAVLIFSKKGELLRV